MLALFDFLSALAGVIGCALSVFLLIRDRLRERLFFSLDVVDFASRGNSTYLYLLIVNRSRLPLVITSFSFDGTICELDPKCIRNNPRDWNFQHTPQFPLAIAAQAAQMAYIEFASPQQRRLTPGMPVTLQIQTIGKAVRRTVILGKPLRYLNTNRGIR